MLLRRRFRPQWLIAAGLFGMAVYTATLRAGTPAVHLSDAARGVWAGFCIGLALVGVSLLAKQKARPRS
jgi:hypothetical protein